MKYLFPLLILALFLTSCRKERCKVDYGVYNFEIPATISPAKDTFNIGDTITIVSTFSDEVYEKETNRTYILENFDFFPLTSIQKIDTIGGVDDFSEFEVLISPAYNYSFLTYSDGLKHLIGRYNYMDNTYNLAYKIVPKEKGLYLFSHGSALYPNGRHQDFEGKCANLESEVRVIMNDGASNNIDMLNDSPDPHFNEWILIKPEERFHRFGGYVFYVKE